MVQIIEVAVAEEGPMLMLMVPEAKVDPAS
jgi:hypothetical protein